MRKFLFLLLAMVSLSAQGQDSRDSLNIYDDGMYYTANMFKKENPVPERVNNAHLWKAGVYQRKSAIFEACAWVAGIAGGIAFSGVLTEKRDMSNITGIGFGVLSVAFFLGSIDYKMKSGAELKLSATGVRVTF